jgi:hypothetical protein
VTLGDPQKEKEIKREWDLIGNLLRIGINLIRVVRSRDLYCGETSKAKPFSFLEGYLSREISISRGHGV